MWLFLNNAFLSVVSKGPDPSQLCVRARKKGDIERVFPGFDVVPNAGTDYPYRAYIPREMVVRQIENLINGLDYGNFKKSVAEPDRHEAYMRVWDVMYRYQKAENVAGSRRHHDD